MTLKGHLSKFSLPEIFQFLEQGYKTGLLKLRCLPSEPMQKEQLYYVWLQQGRIVAAADSLDDRRLISMLAQRGWVSEAIALKALQSSGAKTALGLCLKTHGLLQAEQIKLLFRNQISNYVSPLFQFNDGEFEFDFKSTSPLAEMTGLSMAATEATLAGLRCLRDWSALSAKLPEPISGLQSKINGQPQLQLESLEWQVWEYANGSVSLQKIAQELELPLLKVQQIAFRLIVSNLAEEVFLIPLDSSPPIITRQEPEVFEDLDSTNAFNQLMSPPKPAVTSGSTSSKAFLEKNKKDTPPVVEKAFDPIPDLSPKTNISQSFLQNLVGFLQAKSAS